MITFSYRFKKRKNKKIFLSVFLTALAGIFLIFLITLNVKISRERDKLQRELANLDRDLKAAQTKREELTAKISEAQSSDYLEEVAREDLNLQKEGEKVVAFPIIREKEEKKEEAEKNFLGEISDWLLKKLKIK